MKPLLLLALLSTMLAAPSSAAEMVVLLHGVASSPLQLSRLAVRLKDAGYDVVNLAYPSRAMSVEKISANWLPAHLRECEAEAAPRLHFVTHSMGGIVLRRWLATQPRPDNLGHVVMLAPPNAGSEVTDRLRSFPPYHWIIGVNAGRLGTRPTDLPATLGPWPADAPPLGIIAGDRTFNLLFSAWLGGPNDGKVAVTRTRLDGMREGIVLHHSHTLLPLYHDTFVQVRSFLRDGEFDRRLALRK